MREPGGMRSWPPPYAAMTGRGQETPEERGPSSGRPGGRRSLLVVVAVLALVVGLGGGALGAYLMEPGEAAPEPVAGPQMAPLATHAPVIIEGSGEANPVIPVAQAVLPSVVAIDVRAGNVHVTGSGFVYDQAGHVVTNSHVVEPAADGGTITVTLANGRSVHAEVVGRSTSYDLAVVRLNTKRVPPPVALGTSSDVQVGEGVVAFGSPLGLNATVTSGIISATERAVSAGPQDDRSYINALQTDAAINPGNSGGPLVDLSGQVVGVNSAIATVSPVEGEAGNIGVGFAIPIHQVRRTVGQILQTGHAVYPVIGARVSVQPSRRGATIVGVRDGGPADQAGLSAGDVVRAIDGHRVHDGVELIVQIRSHLPGEHVTLTLRHDGTTEQTEVVLGREEG